MLNAKNIATNVEIITNADIDKIDVLVRKSKTEVLTMLCKNENEIEDKNIYEIEDIIEDITIFKLNTLNKSGIKNEKFDVISIEYLEDVTYPKTLQNKIDKLVNKINPNSSYVKNKYSTLDSPFL